MLVLQQVRWAARVGRPMRQFPVVNADGHWWEALRYETETDAAEVDRMRSRVLESNAKLAEELLPEEVRLQSVPAPLRKMMRNVHGPLIERLCRDMNFEDVTFLERLTSGFPVVGMIDCTQVGMVADPGGCDPGVVWSGTR